MREKVVLGGLGGVEGFFVLGFLIIVCVGQGVDGFYFLLRLTKKSLKQTKNKVP